MQKTDKGISLGSNTHGEWKLNPSDDYWKTEESIQRYRKHLRYMNSSGLNSEDAYDEALKLLKMDFGKNNLPPWSEKIKEWY